MRHDRLNPDIAVAISRDPELRKRLRRVAIEIRKLARKNAPKDTKAGAKSIQVRRGVNRRTKVSEFRVSWDRDHFYMASHESGANLKNGGKIEAQHFLRDAAEQIQGRGAPQ